MIKPAQLRDIISRANPYLSRDPDKLQVFLDSGKIVATGAVSLSFEYQYTLNLIVQDFPYHADQIILPMLAYLRTQQPELFENHDLAKNLIRFDAEILNESVLDLSIQVDLTERVIVSKGTEGRLTAVHVGEPDHPDFPAQAIEIDIYDRPSDTHLGTFSMPAWDPKF